jgi:hypothetical protein
MAVLRTSSPSRGSRRIYCSWPNRTIRHCWIGGENDECMRYFLARPFSANVCYLPGDLARANRWHFDEAAFGEVRSTPRRSGMFHAGRSGTQIPHTLSSLTLVTLPYAILAWGSRFGPFKSTTCHYRVRSPLGYLPPQRPRMRQTFRGPLSLVGSPLKPGVDRCSVTHAYLGWAHSAQCTRVRLGDVHMAPHVKADLCSSCKVRSFTPAYVMVQIIRSWERAFSLSPSISPLALISPMEHCFHLPSFPVLAATIPHLVHLPPHALDPHFSTFITHDALSLACVGRLLLLLSSRPS